MKIVIISDYNYPEMYLIHQIQKVYPSAVVVAPKRLVDRHNPAPFYKRKRFFYHFLNGILWKIHRIRSEKKFFSDGNLPDISNIIPIVWSEINDKVNREKISSIEPDILITCGAPILKMNIIELSKIASINIHFGIAPAYRGNNTLFWPLYLRDFDQIGGTIHHLSHGVDTGNLISRGYPALDHTDDEVSVEYKTAMVLGEMVLDFLKTAAKPDSNISGVKQRSSGHNYKFADRTLIKDLRYFCNRFLKKGRPVSNKERIEYYY